MSNELPIRITLLQIPIGVTFRLQRGKAELVVPTQASEGNLSFDFTVRIGTAQANGAPNFLGPFTQGPPEDRFIYINSGTLAGQTDTTWTRRAKVKLAGITQPLIDAALTTPGAVVAVCIAGKAKDGGPPAATVPLLDGGWQLLSK